MVNFLEITAGPHAGSRYRLEHGLQVGRTQGEIILNDPKVSGLHAQIELDGKGQFVLVDLDSSNGLFINGRRVKRVALLPGVSFEIGRTPCRIVQVVETEAEDYGRVVTWRHTLQEFLTNHEQGNAVKNGEGLPFLAPLQLKFIQGVQFNQTVVLGYGPRTFGTDTLDMELLDPEAPRIAFEIYPFEAMAKIKNLAQNKVLLNNDFVETAVLNDGDVISVGDSLIQIHYT